MIRFSLTLDPDYEDLTVGEHESPERDLWINVIRQWVADLKALPLSDGRARIEQRRAAVEVIYLRDYFFDVVAFNAGFESSMSKTIYREMVQLAKKILDCERFPSPTLPLGVEEEEEEAENEPEGDEERGGEDA